MNRVRKPSMAEVGRVAGVSHQTVSRVINSKGYVSRDTRERVEDAMAKLDFHPNRLARGLALSQTDSVGVINVGKPENASLAQTHYGISTSAAEAALSVTLANVPDDSGPEALNASVLSALDSFLSQGVDGIILVSPYAMEFEVVTRLSREMPVVELASDSVLGISSISTDSVLGGALAARHLIQLGHRQIARVDGPIDRADASDRARGFDRILSDVGVGLSYQTRGDFTSSSGYSAGVELRSRDDVTAIFCANDQMALGLIHAFYEVGKFAPRDFSVIGFDGLDDSEHFIPPLTTVRQDFVEIGRQALSELQRIIAGGEPKKIVLTPELVIRSSTAALSSPGSV